MHAAAELQAVPRRELQVKLQMTLQRAAAELQVKL